MVLTVEKNPCVSTPTQVQTCVVEGSAVGKKKGSLNFPLINKLKEMVFRCYSENGLHILSGFLW